MCVVGTVIHLADCKASGGLRRGCQLQVLQALDNQRLLGSSNERFNHLNIEKTPLFNIRYSFAGGQLALIKLWS